MPGSGVGAAAGSAGTRSERPVMFAASGSPSANASACFINSCTSSFGGRPISSCSSSCGSAALASVTNAIMLGVGSSV